DESAVGVVAQPVEWTSEGQGVAVVVAAHLHAAVATRVQEDVKLLLAVAHEQDSFLAHARLEVVAGVRHLALVSDEQPRPREKLLELLLIDIRVNEHLAADLAALDIHQLTQRAAAHHDHMITSDPVLSS